LEHRIEPTNPRPLEAHAALKRFLAGCREGLGKLL
jgi:hypothetical protein